MKLGGKRRRKRDDFPLCLGLEEQEQKQTDCEEEEEEDEELRSYQSSYFCSSTWKNNGRNIA